MKKKLFSGILAALMCVCMAIGLTACNNDKPDNGGGEDKAITEGVFDGTYTAGGFTMDVYFRFHENGEILDGKQTFYYHAYSGAIAGTAPLLGIYEVLDEEITVREVAPKASQRKQNQDKDFTASKTVVLKNLDGVEYCRTGWDAKEGLLLGFKQGSDTKGLIPDGYATEYCYVQTTETKTDHGVEMNKFYANVGDVRNASITLFHNGTYADDKVTGTETINGTYTVSNGVYTLTAGTGAKSGTLTVTESGATFAVTGADSITMSKTRDRVPVEGKVFTGTGVPTGMTTEVTITVTLYDDNSVTLTGMGSLEGTWAEVEGAICISVAGTDDIYPEEKTDNDGTYYEFEMSGITCRTVSVKAAVTTLYTLTGTATGKDQTGADTQVEYTLTLASDYKFALNYAGAMDVAKGDWTVLTTGADAGKFQLTVKETFNNMFTIDSTWLVTVTYNSDYTEITELSVEVPAVSAMFISAATLTYSSTPAKTEFLVFTTENEVTSPLAATISYRITLYTDNTLKFERTATSQYIPAAELAGTWTAGTANLPASMVIGEGDTAMNITVTTDWQTFKLSFTVEDLVAGGFPAAEFEYQIPTGA